MPVNPSKKRLNKHQPERNKMIKMDNKKWLIVIAVILVGIFTIMMIGVTQKTEGEKIGESISDIVDSADDGVEEFKEEVKDEIDDHTDSR
jgi:hypothetical protein